MSELVIHVPSYIGPSYMEVDEFGYCVNWVQGITKQDVEMQVFWAEVMGDAPTSILLEISTCDGGSTVEGFSIYNYLRGLGLPIRTRILALAASMAVPLALAADEGPEMDYTAQLMLHSASFGSLLYAPTSTDLRSKAEQLDNTNQLLTDLLIARTGQTAEVVAEWMSKDTWLTATQAKAVGLCGKVIPLTPRLTAVEAETLITARRTQATATMARASQRRQAPAATPRPKGRSATPAARASRVTTPKAKPAARAASISPPMAQNVISITAAQKASAAKVAAFAKKNGITLAFEENATPEAVAEGTKLKGQDASLYTDGPLAEGSAVFNDESLTEPTDDGVYETEDGRDITVAGGVVESIADTAGEGAEATSTGASPAAVTAAVEAALKPVTERLNGIEARFNRAVPPTPKAKGGNGSQVADPKAGAKPQAKSLLKGASTQRTA